MNALVGYTGFVGSNLVTDGSFDHLYNTKNIQESYGTKPDLLVYAGVRSEMFLANTFPEKDFAIVQDAFENIKKIQARQLVLISTISVYGEGAPRGDEDSTIEESRLTAYGAHRLWLEKAVESRFKDSLIVRLPALYGKHLKKNFIYDYIHVIPSLLKYEKFDELTALNSKLRDFYERQSNGFYKLQSLTQAERKELIAFFKSCGFSALNFTDSRARYQFYNLSFLGKHICKALDYGIRKLTIATEPVAAGELYTFLEGKDFINELDKTPIDYNLKSKHAEIFDGRNGYLFGKDFVLQDIKNFIEKERIV